MNDLAKLARDAADEAIADNLPRGAWRCAIGLHSWGYWCHVGYLAKDDVIYGRFQSRTCLRCNRDQERNV